MDDQRQDPRKQTLARLLAKISRLVGSRMRSRLEEIGLHHAQGMILSNLWHQDGPAQNALAQALHITPATATNTLQRMERDGWIERCRDQADQRIVRVYLTEKSQALRATIQATFRELDEELGAALTDSERSDLRALLSKVHRHLSRPDEAAGSDRGADQSGMREKP